MPVFQANTAISDVEQHEVDGGDTAVVWVGRDADDLLDLLKTKQSAFAVQVQQRLTVCLVLGVRLLIAKDGQEDKAVQPPRIRHSNGGNPYKSQLELWLEKTGKDRHLPKPDPNDESSPMYWGTLLAPIVAAHYTKRT